MTLHLLILQSLSKYNLNVMNIYEDITKIDYNTTRLQSDQTNVCGHYVLYYLHMRCRGVSLTDIVNIFEVNFMNNDIYVYDYVNESFSCCQ